MPTLRLLRAAGFAAADEDDAEGALLPDAHGDHLLVAVLEDVEGDGGAGEEDCGQGEQGEFHGVIGLRGSHGDRGALPLKRFGFDPSACAGHDRSFDTSG